MGISYSYYFLIDVYRILQNSYGKYDLITIRYDYKQYTINKDLKEIIEIVEKSYDGVHYFAEGLHFNGIINKGREVFELSMGS